MLTLQFLFWQFGIDEYVVVHQKWVLKSYLSFFLPKNNFHLFVKDNLYFSCHMLYYKMFTKWNEHI